MFGSEKRWDFRWGACLYIMISFFAVVWCNSQCPESQRRSSAARVPNIPEHSVESAFNQAYQRVQHRRAQEKKLVEDGKVISKDAKTAESTHPQANQKPIVYQMDHRQEVFEEASRILTDTFKLTPEQVACGLPLILLTEPSAVKAEQECVSAETIVCNSSAKYRTADGTCNNLDNPTWGSAFSSFNRLFTPIYTGNGGFRQSTVSCGSLPDPRRLSLALHTGHSSRAAKVNSMYMSFGQLLDHDITFTAQSIAASGVGLQCCPITYANYHQCAPIRINRFDPFYSKYNVTCLNFVRSAMYPTCTLGARQHINTVSSFIDCSFIYGNSDNETNSLRAFDGTGTLLVQKNQYGDLLAASNVAHEDHCSIIQHNQTCFRSGDQRVNQNPALTSLQTIWLREHNRVATALKKMNPKWDEETLFQEARKITSAEFQVITYKEWLPLTVGNDLMSAHSLYTYWETTYRKDTNPSMLTEASTAALRFGHSIVFPMIYEIPRRQGDGGHRFRDIFFHPYELYSGSLDPTIRGSTVSFSQSYGSFLSEDLTNYLYRIRGQPTGLDLAAFNIQRGRDHGLRCYVDYCNLCYPQRLVENWDDLVDHHYMTQENMQKLRTIYPHFRDIDLWTGILSEIHVNNGVVGPTGACIIARQFYNLKFGDRFFFLTSGQPSSFTNAQLSQFRWYTTLARIICDNTNITEVQREVMQLPSNTNPIQPCSYLSQVNLNLWKES